MYSLGIDSGSTTTKGVLYDGKNVLRMEMIPTTACPQQSIRQIYEALWSENVGYTVTTGYGRELLTEADKKVTEITCHARGAAFLNPGIGAVVDIGGQDSKAILLDRDLNVIDFLMNDKCAAGTGRFVEVMMRTLERPVAEMDDFVAGCKPLNISSMCTVFAESEIVSLLAKGENPGDIALGVIHSVCRRTAIFAQRLKLEGDIFFSGGLSRFRIFSEVLEQYLNRPVYTSPAAQYAGALGAAVIGYRKLI
nr:acyl-CoA dehydratase activase [Lactonifactor longoviformis]